MVNILHRTQSYNEMSSRYTELPNDYYIPDEARVKAGRQSTKNKQDSENGFTDSDAHYIQAIIEAATKDARIRYEGLLKYGLSRELARIVLPVNQYSRFRASANLRNWLGFLDLRLGDGVQWEMKEYAKAIGEQLKTQFPRTYALFEEGR